MVIQCISPNQRAQQSSTESDAIPVTIKSSLVDLCDYNFRALQHKLRSMTKAIHSRFVSLASRKNHADFETSHCVIAFALYVSAPFLDLLPAFSSGSSDLHHSPCHSVFGLRHMLQPTSVCTLCWPYHERPLDLDNLFQ